MIRRGGLYTLFGSKPMTLFELTDGGITEEQKKDRYHKLSLFQKIKYPKKEIDSCFSSSEHWERWTLYWEKEKSPKYIFCQRWNLGFFINVAETTWILHKYYDQFYQAVKQDFDPLETARDISNPDSTFWNTLGQPNKNHNLWGLLFGYGEKLAYLYELGYKGYFYDDDKVFVDFTSVNLKIDSLPIPSFKIFSPTDEMIDYYQKERTKIIYILNGKDFFEEVLFYLKSDDPVISPHPL